MKIKIYFIVLIVIVSSITEIWGLRHYSKKEMLELREEVRAMFQHAYEGYLKHASDYDELRPLTCDGVDTWGSYSLTLIDALDTLATMGNFSEFRRVAMLLEEKMDFDKDINVSVFETNIRIVGGLLAAHLLSKRAGLSLETGWPCQGPLLRMAENVAKRLLPAFDTATGMPYGTVNLRYGVPKDETTVTCTAGVGTFLVEFGTLSRLTGNPIYEEAALNAIYALWERRSPIGLLGNHIDVQTGRWTALDSGIGAGVDSFFEYLVKGAILLNRPDLLDMFHEARYAIDKYLKRDDWYIWVGMNKGQVTLPVFQSLEAFWPGLLTLTGDTGPAMRTLARYSSVWRKYGFLPEFYNIPAGEASPNRESYPLRPELAESTMYLYRATKNQFLLELGENMLHSIEFSAKTKCGYATIRNVVNHEKDNRMESFFLAETTKYLYLLFDEENFLHNDAGSGELLETPQGHCVTHAGPYIFNTEAHPVDVSALYCCHDLKEDIFDGLDLEMFRDDVLLKEERLRIQKNSEQNTKYQCADIPVMGPRPNIQQITGNTNLSVDIEVLDENDNPADDSLIESFERIKSERKTIPENIVPINQVTVTDLVDFFNAKPTQFSSAEAALEFVQQFMRNFTLNSSFIRGLQLFDKNVGNVLGFMAQKEYEEQTRTLWELYELQQQQLVNAKLATQLNLDQEENRENLKNILAALNYNTSGENDALRKLLEQINVLRLDYEISLVNTTSMQEFLLKILINGTTEKKRSFKPLLTDIDVLAISAPLMDAKTKHELFRIVRRKIELKQKMIEAFEKMQALLQESNVLSNLYYTPKAQKDENFKEPKSGKSSEQTTASSKNVQTAEVGNKQVSESKDPTVHANDSEANDDSESQSVWAQLVQTILRKTTTQRRQFDEEFLLRKTRQSMQKFAAKIKMRYELFTCQRPRFYEKFAYRDFYPSTST